uniref:Uncharacterized protein n=1 Tax=Canis lupus familiaris TaxID=9615 RepID=A0A8C0Q8T8_CANLF
PWRQRLGPGGAAALSTGEMRKILPRLVSHAELRKLFCSADAVWFEVDSTIIREDGIDELAKLYELRILCQRWHGKPWVGHAFHGCPHRALSSDPAWQGSGAMADSSAPLTPDPGIKELVSRLQ